jgi:predicted HAD superfamily hydrolase
MKSVLSKYDVISFDMFDTLVSRVVSNPTDVFDIVESKYNSCHKNIIESFKKNRIAAEREAYTELCNGVEEITFDNIYSILEKVYTKNVCDELKKIELSIEYDVCIPNFFVINKYYNYCKENGKRVIVTSDMYLPQTLIERILKKCNIDYDFLYLSNTIGKKKRYSLFDYVIEHEHIKKNQLVHIGDNLIIDCLSPIRHHIRSIKVPRKKYNSNLDKFIDKFAPIDDFYVSFGYKYFGPILLGYSKYIHDSLENKKRYFLSRDGYIMKKAYECLYGKSDNNIYMYASRRSLIVPTIWSCDTYADMFSKFTIKDRLSIRRAFKILGLDNSIIDENISKDEVDKIVDKKYLFKDEFQKKYSGLFSIVKKNSKIEYDNLCSYLKSVGFDNNSNIIDIGWNGNMQLALCKLFEFKNKKPNINGYYVGVDKNSKNISKISMNGYLFDNIKNLELFYSEKSINNLFESFFLAPHGSVLKYNSDNTPVLSEYEYSDAEASLYQKIQHGALSFLNDINKYNLLNYLCNTPNEAYKNMMDFSYNPSLKMIKKFGDIQFNDNGIFYIAKPRHIIYYLFHPKKFMRDLQTSGWMIGFMKRLTKVNLAYKKIYIILFKHYENIKYKKES